MIDCINPDVRFTSAASRSEINLGFPGFDEMLTEKTASNQVTRHGFVGDGQDLCPWLNENNVDVINAIMSLTDGLEEIWKIVLRLEKHIDPRTSGESIIEELDNAAGRSCAAALLTRLWKKKELSGDTALENDAHVTDL